jgi:UDP-N-acetylmuramoyl-tripeptide--D-alanyl-D-alanine ligase
MLMTTKEIRDAISSSNEIGNLDIQSVSTDSRTIRNGALFVALRGENFDGNKYAAVALGNGAAAAVVDTPITGFESRCLLVRDTLTAYGQIARLWRKQFSIPVVAVTGSVGKTTMKEMISLALAPLGVVLKSAMNENNEVGVPQTLLCLTENHRAAVIEMGMRGAGQIHYLTEIALPTIAVITKIGESHIEMVGSREGIADAKGELLESLEPMDIAVLNADDPFYAYLRDKTSAHVLSYGKAKAADIRIVDAVQIGSKWKISLDVLGGACTMSINSPAFHDVLNAAGAVAAAVAAGVDIDKAVQALGTYQPIDMRMQVLHSRSGAAVINDCYNAAPSSVISALQTLAEYPKTGTRLAFLGDMRELGSYSQHLHCEVADFAGSVGIDDIYAIGEVMPTVFPKATAAFKTSEEASEYVLNGFTLLPDDVVLVKGSRALQLEKVVKALVSL